MNLVVVALALFVLRPLRQRVIAKGSWKLLYQLVPGGASIAVLVNPAIHIVTEGEPFHTDRNITRSYLPSE